MPSSGDASCLEAVRNYIRTYSTDGKETNWVEVFVDFMGAQPTDDEKGVYKDAEDVLRKCDVILKDVISYGKGGSTHIIGINDSDIAQVKRAMAALEPNVRRIVSYCEHLALVEEVVPDLLWELTMSPLPLNVLLNSRQAIARQFARLLIFVFDFDHAFLNTPSAINDYSFFRRCCSICTNQGVNHSEEALGAQGQMQVFLCQRNPLVNAFCKGINAFVQKRAPLPRSHTSDVFVTFVNVCRYMLSTEDCLEQMSEEMKLFCARLMVNTAVVYDHVEPAGVFVATSAIDVRDVVRIIKQLFPVEEQSEFILAPLRFMSCHFRDPSTPKSVLKMLNKQF